MPIDAGTGFVDILPAVNPLVFNSALNRQLAPALARSRGTLSGAAKGLGAAIGAPLGAAAAGAAIFGIGKLTLSFEDAFTRIAALSNASAQDIEHWREEVLKLSGETARAPQELAEALFFLASAGLKSEQIMPALEQSARAAAVGLGTTADVAKITANALNAYAASGLTSADVTDTLVAAVREGTAAPEEFALALGRILPIASRAGVEFDEVAGSLAALSNIGLDVNEGVTSMTGLLQALVAPGTAAGQALADVGIAAEQMREVLSEGGLPAALALLEERTGGNLDVLKKIIPNIRGLRGELGLTGENAETVAGIMERVTEATGSADEAFRKTARSTGFTLNQALTDLKVAAIEVGDAFLPIIHNVVPVLVKGFQAVADVAAPVIKVFGELVEAGKSADSEIHKMGESIREISPFTESARERAAGLGDELENLASRAGAMNIEQVTAELEGMAEAEDLTWRNAENLATGLTELAEAAPTLTVAELTERVNELAEANGVAWENEAALVAGLRNQDPLLLRTADTFAALGATVSGTGAIIAALGPKVDVVGGKIVSFAGMSGTALDEFEASLQDTFHVTDDVFSALANKANLTADKIIAAFTKQQRALANYEDNLVTVRDRGIPEELLAQLSEMGLEGAAILEILATTSDRKFAQIIRAMLGLERQSGRTATAVTKIVQAMNNLRSKSISIDVFLNRHGFEGTGGGDSLIGGITVAQGGIIPGQRGFITRGPTMLVGESRRPTPFGRGAEAVIPFDSRGMGILSEAIQRAMSQGRGGADSPDVAAAVAHGIREGLRGLEVRMEGERVGRVVTRQQARSRSLVGD